MLQQRALSLHLQYNFAFPINQNMQPFRNLTPGQDLFAEFEFLFLYFLTQIFEEIGMINILKLWYVKF